MTISEAPARVLRDYDWPGNVREIENCIERAIALCQLDEITIEDLPAKLQHRQCPTLGVHGSASELVTLDEVGLRYVPRCAARGRGQQDPRRARARRRPSFAVPPARPADAVVSVRSAAGNTTSCAGARWASCSRCRSLTWPARRTSVVRKTTYARVCHTIELARRFSRVLEGSKGGDGDGERKHSYRG